MLAELGNLPLFATAHEQRENIEVIIQTVERLADVRIGALIAIEQSIQLQEAVESGIPVDCEATPEMLETIFFPNNAIHDGGVIIKGDRIAFAACIFPLTQRQDLNKSLGTRHRAAIGLSEETDAVVVVVSEETGAISYAYKGQFVRGVTLEELRAFLTSVLVEPAHPATGWAGSGPGPPTGSNPARCTWPNPIRPPPPPPPRRPPPPRNRQMIAFLRTLLLHDFWLKLFSLVLAILIWLTISFAIGRGVSPTTTLTSANSKEQTYYNIPVYLMSTAADVRDFKVSPNVVAVKVRGESRRLKDLQAKEIRALIDLSGIEAAPRGLAKRIEVTTPAGITFVQVIPDEVEVIVPPKR